MCIRDRSFRSCSELTSVGDGERVVEWASSVWGTMAMGNYPYPSSYLLHGHSLLPAWPVREACKPLNRHFDLPSDLPELLAAVRESASLVHNSTHDLPCNPILTTEHDNQTVNSRHRKMTSTHGRALGGGSPDGCVGDWDFQWCTEMTQPFTQGTPNDMFYCSPGQNCSAWDLQSAARGCEQQWGVIPRPEWARIGLGGKRIGAASNILFSNGLLDPWHGGGVLANLSDTLVAVLIPNGAHHIDLMFSTEVDGDYPDIGAARALERREMARWVAEARRNRL
eukprot:TRINITY_DN25474_c0_g1_i4.p1 TRINITY_DN25474_c0_g1~~TRINITY_DN25474_c0_g1_i4.p1  ORF type:complete len:281 (+),score=41.41 TRINITY_DN25474_c0_g1_i4:158-1000(+)